jgi:hypothetical protein
MSDHRKHLPNEHHNKAAHLKGATLAEKKQIAKSQGVWAKLMGKVPPHPHRH